MKSEKDCLVVPDLLRNIIQTVRKPDDTFMLDKVGDSWKEISYRHTLETADAISSFLLDSGIKKGDRLGLLIENSPDYVFFDQGLQQLGAVNVSIYPTLSESEIQYILQDAGARMLIVGTPFLFRKVLKISGNCPDLELIIPAFGDYKKHLHNQEPPTRILDFQELVAKGKSLVATYADELSRLRSNVLPSDLCSLIYTSGTTGTPKGVMLTHDNFIKNVQVSLDQIPGINTDDVFLSFLPLSHVFERTATYLICSARGCTIAFAQSLELLAKNMLEIRPTVMIVVPRLLERIQDRAMKSGTSAGGIKARIFLWSLEVGRQFREVQASGRTPGSFLSLKYRIADKMVFSKIREKTGGRLKFMVSGGAALPKNVGEFFGNIGIKILEGFGLTETSPVMTITEVDRQVYGTVGRVIPGIEVAIQNVETKQFITIQTHDSFDPGLISDEGEIVVRGHCVMKGYWNKPEETERVIDPDGWFHTGDVGRFYKGYLQITDRIKNMLVNAFGKNVYPTPVENIYLKSSKIDQIFLIGDKREYLTAIIVPSKETLQEKFNLPEEFFSLPEAFIDDKAIVDWISEDVRKFSGELAKFERIRNFKIKRTPFSIEAGEITPTLKAKRKVIEQKYAEEIDEMYLHEINEA